MLPSQQKAVSTALSFVDSYLNQASQGMFVGIGIVFLLWTVISLLSHIETAFNTIWDIKRERSLYQKITDYIAICLIIPVLMICSSGVSIFMSTTIQDKLNLPFLTPFVNIALEATPLILRLRSIKEFTARFKVRMILIFIVCLGSFQTPVMQ